jgi:hypothetical protein
MGTLPAAGGIDARGVLYEKKIPPGSRIGLICSPARSWKGCCSKREKSGGSTIRPKGWNGCMIGDRNSGNAQISISVYALITFLI